MSEMGTDLWSFLGIILKRNKRLRIVGIEWGKDVI